MENKMSEAKIFHKIIIREQTNCKQLIKTIIVFVAYEKILLLQTKLQKQISYIFG